MSQRIAMGADHGAVDLKDSVVAYLRDKGYAVDDLGTHGHASVDYPDFADLVTSRVLDGSADAGMLFCTTGIGMSIAANRHPGIQASLVTDVETAKITREHNNSNVLVTISIDGTNTVDVAPANSFWLYDEGKGAPYVNQPALPAGTQFYINGAAGAGNTGLIYLVTQYIVSV